MKKVSLVNRQNILYGCVVLYILEAFTVLMLYYLGAFSGNRVAQNILFIVIFVQAVSLSLLCIQNIRRLKEYQHLCQRFVEGEIYQDFIEQIGAWDSFLGDAIKRMDELTERKNVMQLSTKQAEFLALQNQINPHFLYNTLEAIRGDALCLGADKIADITEALSVFFRYTITNTRNLVTFQEELDNVENYFIIQKYRFGDKLELSTNFEDDERILMRILCPKLSLQPIVENAIFHGIEKRREGGLVEIDVELVNDTVHINISDNGIGMTAEKLKQLNVGLQNASVGHIQEENKKNGGIALKNVSRRIKLLFGEDYGLRVSSIEGMGTNVEMTLPIKLSEDDA
ncbi:MAG: sensor histidine kinase [Lachnospiraceae bacterium]|nr:sensor histidine kinase [Lachnospiraceae bacterium]